MLAFVVSDSGRLWYCMHVCAFEIFSFYLLLNCGQMSAPFWTVALWNSPVWVVSCELWTVALWKFTSVSSELCLLLFWTRSIIFPSVLYGISPLRLESPHLWKVLSGATQPWAPVQIYGKSQKCQTVVQLESWMERKHVTLWTATVSAFCLHMALSLTNKLKQERHALKGPSSRSKSTASLSPGSSAFIETVAVKITPWSSLHKILTVHCLELSRVLRVESLLFSPSTEGICKWL